MNQVIDIKAVYRTAPATLGLLIIVDSDKKEKVEGCWIKFYIC